MIEKNKSGIKVNKYLDKNYQLILISSFFYISIITILNYLKIKNGNENYYDFGLYINYLINFFETDLIYHVYGHVKLFLIPFAAIFNYLDLNIAILIFILFKNFCFLFPILFLKINWYQFFLIILNPFLFYNILGNINFDFLAIPLFFIYLFKENKNDFYSIIILSLIILVKEVYFFIVLPLYLYENKKYLSSKRVLLFSLIMIMQFLFLYYLINLANEVIIDSNNVFEKIKNDKGNILKYFLTYIYLSIIIFIVLFFINLKDLIKLVIFLPYFLILMYLGKDNYINVFNHYLMPLYPFIYKLSHINGLNLQNTKKIKCHFIFILLFIFSSYPLSLNFFSEKITNKYTYNNYVIKNNIEIIGEKNIKYITAMNNSYHYSLNENHIIIPFPLGNIVPYREYKCTNKCSLLNRILKKSNYDFIEIKTNFNIYSKNKNIFFFYDKIIDKESYLKVIDKN